MAEEGTVTDRICFKEFLEQWKGELTAKDVHSMTSSDKCLTIHCQEYMKDDFKQSFEEFAAEYMAPDVIVELDAECRLVTTVSGVVFLLY